MVKVLSVRLITDQAIDHFSIATRVDLGEMVYVADHFRIRLYEDEEVHEDQRRFVFVRGYLNAHEERRTSLHHHKPNAKLTKDTVANICIKVLNRVHFKGVLKGL